MLCKTGVRLLMATVAGLLGAAPIAVAEESLDLTRANSPRASYEYIVKGEDAGAFLLTGIRRETSSRTRWDLLAVSPVDPVPVATTPASEQLFGGETRRPLTWKEADASCKAYTAGEKQWTLPGTYDMDQLSVELRIREKILEAKEGRETLLNGAFVKFADALPQFRYFWMADGDAQLEPGLKLAGTFGPKPHYQPMSAIRPLSVICVTTFTAPGLKALSTASGDSEAATKQ